MMTHHYEQTALIPAPREEVFELVDDHTRFAAHMSKASWMMGGGEMKVELDAGHGRAVGSHIRLSGVVCGVRLFLDEVVTRRDPPALKVWETVADPRLLVVGAYRMGVQLTQAGRKTRLRVFIDYGLPTGWAGHSLGLAFGGIYARWCVKQMLEGTASCFADEATLAA